mmetsp:Transcript_16605/g.24538  ORF Transcript_16605/g.24538 Transcript_16605/m.24538 type:complete len:685 (+) Transcript_16605:91-2145(+)
MTSSDDEENRFEGSAADIADYTVDDVIDAQEDAAGLKKLSPSQKIVANPKVYLKRSGFALKIGVLADAVNATILQPNYPIMATVGMEADSFPSIEPFGFSGATYFIPMTALLGVAISSVVIGSISDRIGRKPCILFCLYASFILSMVKYFVRGNFWVFCAVNFANGLCSATCSLGMAYMGDVYSDVDEKTFQIGMVGMSSLVGTSVGGICAILMDDQGLFAPLWIGSALMAIAAALNTFMLIEPKDYLKATSDYKDKEKEVIKRWEDKEDPPEELDNCVLWNIIAGAFFDNVGTAGLNPMCVTPVAYTMYFVTPNPPVLSLISYKWVSTLIGLMIIPAALASSKVFSSFGTAFTCISANVVTGILTIILVFIAIDAPATGSFLALFLILLYCGFPVTVFSNLTTGPMLDIITPPPKRGYTQGLNNSVMNLGQALTPWLLGLLSDATSIRTAILTCSGISFFAAMVNTPLLRHKGLRRRPKKTPAHSRVLNGEDEEIIEKALRGEYVPIREVDWINEERIKKGQPILILRPGKYEDEKELDQLRANAMNDFRQITTRRQLFIGDLKDRSKKERICRMIAEIDERVDEDAKSEVNAEIGQWFTDYLNHNGYQPYMSATVTKQMIMSVFPPISRGKFTAELTPDNVEEKLLNTEKVYRQFIKLEEDNPYSERFTTLLANRGAAYKIY